MAALIVDIADAVTAALKAENFGVEIPWERSYGDWDLELKEVGCIRGDVVPVFTSPVRLETQGSAVFDLNIDVAVRKRFDGQTDIECGRINLEEIDALVALMQAVQVLFIKWRPDDVDAAWHPARDGEVQAWYVKDHLRTWNQFTGVVRIPIYAAVAL